MIVKELKKQVFVVKPGLKHQYFPDCPLWKLRGQTQDKKVAEDCRKQTAIDQSIRATFFKYNK